MCDLVGATRIEAPGDNLPAVNLSLERANARSCERCHTDLSSCTSAARFCPRCGEPLARREAQTAPPPPLVVPPPLPVLSFRSRSDRSTTHSLILGYANAMFRLGWRYEQGHGASRNVDEAVRCYFKAAKLGNTAALARLEPKCVKEQGMAAACVSPSAATG